MQLFNLTPFPAAIFRQYDLEGGLEGYVAARACFLVEPDAPMAQASSQPQFRWEDAYEGDPQTSCLIGPSDLTPHKPATDITFIGESYAPRGQDAPSWKAGIQIANRLNKRLLVTGPREWRPKTKKIVKGFLRPTTSIVLEEWELSAPKTVDCVPLDWSRAAGGLTFGLDPKEPNEPHIENPIGIGRIDEKRSAFDRSWPAPQITNIDEPLHANRQASPAGFGPVSPWWEQRLRYAGTYDETWVLERHPLSPKNFDYRFWQYAPPDMVISPYLQGDEEFCLENLHPNYDFLSGRLPGLAMRARVHRAGEETPCDYDLALDGVHFDFRQGRLECSLTFRARFPLDEALGSRTILRALNREGRSWRDRYNPLRRKEMGL